MTTTTEREQIEIDYWRDQPHERPGPLTVPNIVNKMADAGRFFTFFGTYQSLFRGRVVELGAGQGWAACMAKRLAPEAHVIATDISPYAIDSAKHWEQLWQVKLDGCYTCRAHETNERHGSVDLAFCFASAHHFDQAKTIVELARILRPGGAALFLYEPTVRAALYRVQVWRMNRARPTVPEDAIVPSRLSALAERAGLAVSFDYVEPKGWISKPANIVIRKPR